MRFCQTIVHSSLHTLCTFMSTLSHVTAFLRENYINIFYNVEQYSIGTGISAHNVRVEHEAKLNYSALSARHPYSKVPWISTCLSKTPQNLYYTMQMYNSSLTCTVLLMFRLFRKVLALKKMRDIARLTENICVEFTKVQIIIGIEMH